MISTLSGLTYKNIGKVANKIFNIPNHLKHSLEFLKLFKLANIH